MLEATVFDCLYFELAAETKVPEGLGHARAHVARMVLFDTESCNEQFRRAREWPVWPPGAGLLNKYWLSYESLRARAKTN